MPMEVSLFQKPTWFVSQEAWMVKVQEIGHHCHKSNYLSFLPRVFNLILVFHVHKSTQVYIDGEIIAIL